MQQDKEETSIYQRRGADKEQDFVGLLLEVDSIA
jgi:hypothetical protein